MALLASLAVELIAKYDSINQMERAVTTKLNAMAGAAATLGAAMSAAVSAPLLMVGKSAVQMSIQMESARMAFTHFLGSAQKTGEFLEKLKDFSARTPFEFQELQPAAMKLMAVGVAADNVIPIMTALGNATASIGTGSAGIQRAVYALQEMAQGGMVTAKEMRQLTQAGIPAWDALAAVLHTNVAGAMAAVKARTVEAGEMFKAIEQQAGPAFQRLGNMMEIQSQSLGGLLSTLREKWGYFLADMGEEISNSLNIKGWVTTITASLQTLLDAFRAMPPLMKEAVLGFAGLAAAAGPALLAFAGIVKILPALALGWEAVSAAAATAGAATVAAAMTPVAALGIQAGAVGILTAAWATLEGVLVSGAALAINGVLGLEAAIVGLGGAVGAASIGAVAATVAVGAAVGAAAGIGVAKAMEATAEWISGTRNAVAITEDAYNGLADELNHVHNQNIKLHAGLGIAQDALRRTASEAGGLGDAFLKAFDISKLKTSQFVSNVQTVVDSFNPLENALGAVSSKMEGWGQSIAAAAVPAEHIHVVMSEVLKASGAYEAALRAQEAAARSKNAELKAQAAAAVENAKAWKTFADGMLMATDEFKRDKENLVKGLADFMARGNTSFAEIEARVGTFSSKWHVDFMAMLKDVMDLAQALAKKPDWKGFFSEIKGLNLKDLMDNPAIVDKAGGPVRLAQMYDMGSKGLDALRDMWGAAASKASGFFTSGVAPVVEKYDQAQSDAKMNLQLGLDSEAQAELQGWMHDVVALSKTGADERGARLEALQRNLGEAGDWAMQKIAMESKTWGSVTTAADACAQQLDLLGQVGMDAADGINATAALTKSTGELIASDRARAAEASKAWRDQLNQADAILARGLKTEKFISGWSDAIDTMKAAFYITGDQVAALAPHVQGLDVIMKNLTESGNAAVGALGLVGSVGMHALEQVNTSNLRLVQALETMSSGASITDDWMKKLSGAMQTMAPAIDLFGKAVNKAAGAATDAAATMGFIKKITAEKTGSGLTGAGSAIDPMTAGVLSQGWFDSAGKWHPKGGPIMGGQLGGLNPNSYTPIPTDVTPAQQKDEAPGETIGRTIANMLIAAGPKETINTKVLLDSRVLLEQLSEARQKDKDANPSHGF